MMDMESYTPFGENGRQFKNYLNQAFATSSGSIPSAGQLDQIIGSELNKAYSRKLEGNRIAENTREFNVNTDLREKELRYKSATGLLGTAAQLGTMYELGIPYLKQKAAHDLGIWTNNIYDIGGTSVEGRASGGDIEKDKPYVVGEKGPEVVVPSKDGKVVPHSVLEDLAKMLGSGMARKTASLFDKRTKELDSIN
jgi:hypothetical protein